MATGLAPSEICFTTYNELKRKHKYDCIVFALSQKDEEIVVERTHEAPPHTEAQRTAKFWVDRYNEFTDTLDDGACRWIIYDFHYEENGMIRDKIVFISWSPDTAPVKSKMTFASSKDGLRKRLEGIGCEIQGTDRDEISYKTVLDKILKLK